MKSSNVWWQQWEDIWARRLFLACVFFAPFSLPTARLLLALAFLGLLVQRGNRTHRVRLTYSFWLWVLYVLVAVVASWQGLDPAYSLDKCTKLLWFMGIPVAATLVNRRTDTLRVLQAYVLGSLVRALDILVLRVLEAYQAAEGDFLWQLIDRGSMTHGQVLLLAMTAAVGLWSIRGMPRGPVSRTTANVGVLVLLAGAQLANFKRGSWVVTGGVIGLFSLLSGRWKWCCGVVLLAGSLLFVPAVQQRVLQLRNELDLEHGGRLVMWTRIAPTLLQRYPMGVGFRGVQDEVMQATARSQGVRVEQNRNHLHSNLVEIPVTLGWAGLLVYVTWMTWAVYSGVRTTLALRRFGPEASQLALTCSLMLIGLFMNGIVEYNMGDAYLILIYGILLGILSRGTAPFLPGRDPAAA